jgi:hypothetical protein
MQSSPEDVTTTSAPLGQLEPLGAVLPGVEAMQQQVRSWRRRQVAAGREEDAAGAESAQVVLELEGAGEETRAADTPRPVPALLEYELARRGLFALEPNRRMEGLQDTEDMVGVFTVETPVGLGQLSVFELELMIWIMGRWDERGDDKVRFTLRECARDFGTSWGGSRAEFLANALDRLHGTRFKAVRFRQRVRRRSRRWEHMLDEVEWEERADSLEGPSRGHVVVTVTLGRALAQRLRAKEAKRIDWATLHRKIQSELGKRLYAFLEAQKGFPIDDETDGQALVIYEVTITEALLATLGCRDSHARRLRGKLAKAGEEITSADESYKHVGVRRGKGRGVHLLRMLRAAS